MDENNVRLVIDVQPKTDKVVQEICRICYNIQERLRI